jgi:tetratricopeptide (TPR) repeat protein
MSYGTHNPRSHPLARPLAYLATVAAACVALGAGGADAPSLFGWQRVEIVQAMLALPLCILLARQWYGRQRSRRRGGTVVVYCLAGVAIAGGAAIVVPGLTVVLDGLAAGFWARAIVRGLLCLAIELPWCLAIEAGLTGTREQNRDALSGRSFAVWMLIAVVVAVALPGAYAEDLCRRQTALAGEALERQQLVVALRIISRLRAIGSDQPVRGALPVTLERKLAKTISGLDQHLASVNAAQLDAQRTIDYARALAMLDRTDQAGALVAPLAAARADAALLLATILQQQRRWRESSASYETAVRLLRSAPASQERTAGLVQALDGVAFNAREQGEPAVAVQTYELGLGELPEAAAHFHFQLGRHHHSGGRPALAIAHLQNAVALDPRGYERQAAAILRQLAAGSPGCLLGPGTFSQREPLAK